MCAQDNLLALMPTARDIDLLLNRRIIRERYIIRKLKKLNFADCLFVLSKLSRHYYKYCVMDFGNFSSNLIYRKYCFDLLNADFVQEIETKENNLKSGRRYGIIFPELSIIYLIKLCLRYCSKKGASREEAVPTSVRNTIGECLLVSNALLAEWQERGSPKSDKPTWKLAINFVRQLIVDKNYDVLQKLYQNYFIYNKFFKQYNNSFDLEDVFKRKYGVSVFEYFAFSFLLYSQFCIKNTATEDWETPYVELSQALKNLKPHFTNDLLSNLVINNFKYKKLDRNFSDITGITRRPLVDVKDGVVIPLSLKYLFLGLTDMIYFDVLEFISEKDGKSFSEYFGKAIEDYFVDVIINIDTNVIKSFKYGREHKETPDAILVDKDKNEAIFFECKKRQFHTLEFMKTGDKKLYLNRLNVFCRDPLVQLCKRIEDYRNGEFSIDGLTKDCIIYPVIISPEAMPLLSGMWDEFDLDDIILPEYYSKDKNVERPEFIDLSELGCIEEFLHQNLSKTFIDLIKVKRNDKHYHNGNWMVILQQNNMALSNKRLGREYLAEIKNFRKTLFK